MALYMLLALLVGVALGYAVAAGGNRSKRLTRPEKRELEQLRTMRDGLLEGALDRVEVEPFAVTVIDTIRDTQKEINK